MTPSCIGQLVQAHEKTGGSVVAVMDVPREQTKSYGIAAVKNENGNGSPRSPAWSKSPSRRRRLRPWR